MTQRQAMTHVKLALHHTMLLFSESASPHHTWSKGSPTDLNPLPVREAEALFCMQTLWAQL